MITDIEKQFFETFGIKPRSYLLCTSCWDCIDAQPCEQCHYGKLIEDEYPKITDRILLELICILTKFYGELVLEQCTDVKDLKEQVLNIFIRTSYKDNFKHQVRTLFDEVENENQARN